MSLVGKLWVLRYPPITYKSSPIVDMENSSV